MQTKDDGKHDILWDGLPLNFHPKVGIVTVGESFEEAKAMRIEVIGIDLGKNSCSVVGLDEKGSVVICHRMRRSSLVAFVEARPPCIVGVEACCGAHYVGRQFAAIGHEIRLMPPEYVKAYVNAQKNDDRDAEGIAEAATRPQLSGWFSTSCTTLIQLGSEGFPTHLDTKGINAVRHKNSVH